MQEARAAGCRTSAEAERYFEEKGKKEAEESAQGVKDTPQAGPSGGKDLQSVNTAKGELDGSPQGGLRGPTFLEPGIKDSSSANTGHAIVRPQDVWDITGFPGEDLLSETVRILILINLCINQKRWLYVWAWFSSSKLNVTPPHG